MSIKKESVLRTMTEVAIFAALGYILDMLAGAIWKGVFPNGGSIGISMIAVFIIAFRRGPIAGIATGLIIGLLDIADGFYAIAGSFWGAFAQVALDYWLAYPLVGLCGLAKPLYDRAKSKNAKLGWLIAGCTFGGLMKLLSHFLSGYIFWGDPSGFCWPEFTSPALYSLAYNSAYMLPSIAITLAIVIIIQIKAPSLFESPDELYLRHASKKHAKKEVKEEEVNE